MAADVMQAPSPGQPRRQPFPETARENATHLSRVVTEVVSAGAVLYGSLFPSASFSAAEELVICRGLPNWAYPRGGICLGRVLLTGRAPSPPVIRHEKRHIRQWQRHGLAFPFLYAAAGRDARRNRFEIEAGLSDGNYV